MRTARAVPTPLLCRKTMISRMIFCSAQASVMRLARTRPMPVTSRRRSGSASIVSNTFSPKAARFELLAMGVVVDPFARCRNPLACRDSCGVADDRDQIAMATGLCPQDAETVLAIMEGDTLDKARQYFLGRWFLLWPHLCCRCWRQSPQSDLETCAALALLVSDAVPASTFDRR